MKYVLLLILLSACQGESHTETLAVHSNWFVCPGTKKEMTEFQKQVVLSNAKVDGMPVTFEGVVSDVRFDQMDQAPVIFLNNPSDDGNIDTVFGFVPKELILKASEINKKDKVVLTGHIMGECNTGAIGSVYVDVAVEEIKRIK